jgi:DNA-binding LytR/AlgR family response regulator
MLRLQGEARVLDPPEGAADPLPEAPPDQPLQRPDRFLVRKLRREFLIAASDIDWLQAQGNYVGLRVGGHDYLLRATLSDFLAQLDPARYVRVHRSYAANLDRIAEIEPLDGGDARLHMRDGTQIPCSRRYRSALAA